MNEDSTEETIAESTAVELAAAAPDDNAGEDAGTVIRDTDIVFDCPHCGHNLAIDYRGAGLQINCVNCGETVLVPIPREMKIDDLDLEPGEILKQLFATRRNLQRAEARTVELEAQVYELTARIGAMWAKNETLSMQLGEMRSHCLQQAASNEKLTGLLDRMTAELQNTAQADKPQTGSEDAGDEESAAPAEEEATTEA